MLSLSAYIIATLFKLMNCTLQRGRLGRYVHIYIYCT